MADAAVEFLLTNLKELVDHHSQLIKDASGNIKGLQRDLLVFNAFLKDSVDKRRNNDERTNVMVQQIREVVYELEDIIDAYVNKIMAKKNGTSFLKFLRSPVDLHGIGQLVEDVKTKVEQARKDMDIVTLEDEHRPPGQYQERPPRKKDVVGFEDVAADLIELLTRETDYFDVISLIGMLGLGKTTLAWKVFKDPAIMDKFPIRIWLPISQEFSDKDIFLSILKEYTTISEDIKSLNNSELSELVSAHLERGSFLIVMDDVWETAHWRRLNAFLPANKKGKVLITSRHETVGNLASRSGSVKNLRYFTLEESWKLLRLEALHSLECPPELETVGQLIATNCEGLPLAIVIIGGILAEKCKNSDTGIMKREWETVSRGVTSYLSENDAEKRMKNLISLSFERLPYHLRSCFLYLGMFPEDYEIPVSKLIRLWIGEGFIQEKESRTLEETAQQYLEELINRNLLKSEKFKYNGKVKTCRIHDTLRDFCRTEAANENLVKEIKYVNDKFKPPVSEINKYRRLAVNSNCLGFISSDPSCPSARSFVCFSKEKYELSEEHCAKLFAAFKHLKVFDVEPFKLKKIDSDIYQLVYMRYLVLSCNLSILPSKFSQLWNIQIITVDTKSRTLQVKADIWKMNKLRYFKTNASATLPKPSKSSSEHGKELLTLGTISVESCTAELFNQASNLKRLGIRGNLSSLLDGKIGSFDSLGKMKHIEKLKLIHDVHPYPSSEQPLGGLPQHHQFPSKLMSLTLRATFLPWDKITILGLLENLEVLKLKENAFMGPLWNVVEEGFKSLELLYIEDTDLIKWDASYRHYPKLRSLVLRNCEKLLAIPTDLANIESFQMLELYTSNSAANSARDIKKAKDGKQTKEGKHPAFSLSIL